MINALLPSQLDNAYRGQKVALWIFGLLVLMRTAMSLNSILNAEVVLTAADGIPLQTYPAAAARTIVTLFSLLGLSNLIFYLLSVLVLARYRGMVPLMFTLMLIQQLSARVILYRLPIPRTTSPGSTISLTLLALTIAGLLLSVWRRKSQNFPRTENE